MDTELIFGSGALDFLAGLQAKKVLVVTDSYFTKTGLAQSILQKTGGEGIVFDEAVPDPPAELAAKGAALLHRLQPDLLVALGGGSSIDCAKGILLAAEQRPIFAAVPTTSGTGSEVTSFAVLSHNGVKHPAVDNALRPDYAILDESLLQDLPPSLIADAGMDAVTHCVEAVCAKGHSAVSDSLAQSACRTLLTLLPRSYGGEKSVRGPVHLAATMAGLAFDNAGLGLCHGVMHALGGAFHVPHGRLGGVMLPHVMEQNKAASLSAYAALAQACGVGAATEVIAYRNLKNSLIKLRRQLQLPTTLQEAGIDPTQLEARCKDLAQAVLRDPCMASNPCTVTATEVEALLREAAT